MKKDIQRTNVIRIISTNTIQLDNTQIHVDMQESHQNEIEKWWKEALASWYETCK